MSGPLPPGTPGARGGPTALRPEAFGRLELAVRRKLEGRLHGEYQGLLPGHGSEPGEARRYRPGDDVRRIDWAVTARTNHPHVRETIADHELTAVGLVDLSGSLHFGTGRRQKRDVALEVLGAFGFITAHGANRFGAMVLHPSGEQFFPPKQGRHHVHATLQRISRLPRLTARETGAPTGVDLAGGLRRLARLSPRRGGVMVISDFLGGRRGERPAWARSMRALAERHDVIAVDVVDPRELNLPKVGYLTLADPESGRRRVVDTNDTATRIAFARAAREQREHIAAELRRAGAGHLSVRTDTDWLADVVRHVERRRRAPLTPRCKPQRGALEVFAAPLMLLWILVPLALAITYLVVQSRRSRYAVQFTNLDLLDEVAPDRPGWRRHVPAAALVLALSLLVVALARPVRAEQVPVEASTVVLALDVSISMDARDVEPRRLDAAQAAALRFMDEVPDQVRVGLVTFAENAVANVAPTDDRAIVRSTIESLELRPGTAIGEALLVAVDLIQADLRAIQAETDEEEPVPATIIVLSDGDTTAGRPNAVGVRAAQEAGIAVSTISFGTLDGIIQFQGQLVPVPSNGRALNRIADDTGGRFFDAESAQALTEIFENLGVAVGFTTEEVEIIIPWVVAALVLGTAAGVTSLAWFSRLP